MSSGFNSALSGYGTSGSLYGSAANLNNQADATTASLFSSAAKVFSDEDMKCGTGKIKSGKSARMALEDTPVHEGWEYEEGSVADDGGQPHDGPMAQDIGKTMPEARMKTRMGQMIDPITIQGNLIAAVADISKEVKQMKRVLARMEA